MGPGKDNIKMFENETQNILNKYNESVKFLKKLKNVVGPYDYSGAKHDAIFYNCRPSVYSFSSLEYDAHNALANILKRHDIHRIGKDTRALYNYGSDNLTLKEHVKAINKITIKDFYYNAFYYVAYNELHYDKEEHTFKPNMYERSSAYDSGLFLILNCIHLLDNTEPVTYEQRHKISNLLTSDNTFIFKGCKFSLYKNGRLVVKFSSSETFNKFKAAAQVAINQIKKDIKEA